MSPPRKRGRGAKIWRSPPAPDGAYRASPTTKSNWPVDPPPRPVPIICGSRGRGRVLGGYREMACNRCGALVSEPAAVVDRLHKLGNVVELICMDCWVNDDRGAS